MNGQVLVQVQQDDTPYYYHTDRLGSVRALTNGSGTVANTADYTAYGQPTSTSGSVANPFGYAGEYTDSETGFLYLRARYYDPATQQFLTVDPLLAVTKQTYFDALAVPEPHPPAVAPSRPRHPFTASAGGCRGRLAGPRPHGGPTPLVASLTLQELSADQRFVLKSLVEYTAAARLAAIFALGYWAGLCIGPVGCTYSS